MSVRVKICGITNLADALAAVEAGADALGFVFHDRSPRRVTAAAAADIIGKLPPTVARVGVFVNASEQEVRDTASGCGFDTLQFHGDESPEYCRMFGPLKVWKAFRIRNCESLAAVTRYETDAWLLDAFAPDKSGGTGATFNWDLAVEAGKRVRPTVLAGGLTPDNVAEAVRKVRPFAVDVSSGVEASPGMKDHAKVRAFIAAVRSAAIQ